MDDCEVGRLECMGKMPFHMECINNGRCSRLSGEVVGSNSEKQVFRSRGRRS